MSFLASSKPCSFGFLALIIIASYSEAIVFVSSVLPVSPNIISDDIFLTDSKQPPISCCSSFVIMQVDIVSLGACIANFLSKLTSPKGLLLFINDITNQPNVSD